jgi:hypothetical protein
MQKADYQTIVGLDLNGVFLSCDPKVVEFTVRITAEEPLSGRTRTELAQYYYDWLCRPTKEPPDAE